MSEKNDEIVSHVGSSLPHEIRQSSKTDASGNGHLGIYGYSEAGERRHSRAGGDDSDPVQLWRENRRVWEEFELFWREIGV